MSKRVMGVKAKKAKAPSGTDDAPTCNTCKEPFADGRFTLPPPDQSATPMVKMCIPCYQKMYGRFCVVCESPVAFGDPSLNINGRHHHTHCCRCVECKVDLSTGEEQVALADDGSLLCVPCDSRLRGAICVVCDAVLIGSFVNAVGSKYHAECFRCVSCSVGLGTGEVPCTQGRDKKTYCVPCHKNKLARERAERVEARRCAAEAEAEERRREAEERAEERRREALADAAEAAEREKARLAAEHAAAAQAAAKKAAEDAHNEREAARLAEEYARYEAERLAAEAEALRLHALAEAERLAAEEKAREKREAREKRKAEMEASRRRNARPQRQKNKGRTKMLFKSVKLSETIFDNGRTDTEEAVERYVIRLFCAVLASWGEPTRGAVPCLSVTEFARLLRSSNLPKKMRGNLYVQLHLVQSGRDVAGTHDDALEGTITPRIAQQVVMKAIRGQGVDSDLARWLYSEVGAEVEATAREDSKVGFEVEATAKEEVGGRRFPHVHSLLSCEEEEEEESVAMQMVIDPVSKCSFFVPSSSVRRSSVAMGEWDAIHALVDGGMVESMGSSSSSSSEEEEEEEGDQVGALPVDTTTRQVCLSTAKCVSPSAFACATFLSLLRRFLTHRYSFSHASRRSYYIDPTTGGTAWGDTLRSEGRLPAAAAPPAPAPAAAAVEAPLPPNWSAHYDASSGYYYYNNSVTSATTWERPV